MKYKVAAKVLAKAFEDVTIGGNSLASNLIGILGASKKDFPVRGTPYEDVRELLSARFPDNWIEIYEQWVCWNTIMMARDNVVAILGEDGWIKYV